MLKIDEQNFDCGQFLNIFKETNDHPINTQSIKSAEINLISYNDYKNILNLLEHLDIESITFFSKIDRDDEISNDLLKLCQMATGKDIVTHLNFYQFYRHRYFIECKKQNLQTNLNTAYNDNSVGIIPNGLINITKTLKISFHANCINDDFTTEIAKVVKFAFEKNKYIQFETLYDELDRLDNHGEWWKHQCDKSHAILDKCLFDKDSEYITILEPKIIINC